MDLEYDEPRKRYKNNQILDRIECLRSFQVLSENRLKCRHSHTSFGLVAKLSKFFLQTRGSGKQFC